MEKIEKEFTRGAKGDYGKIISARIGHNHFNWFKKNNINISAFIRSKVENMEGFEVNDGEETEKIEE